MRSFDLSTASLTATTVSAQLLFGFFNDKVAASSIHEQIKLCNETHLRECQRINSQLKEAIDAYNQKPNTFSAFNLLNIIERLRQEFLSKSKLISKKNREDSQDFREIRESLEQLNSYEKSVCVWVDKKIEVLCHHKIKDVTNKKNSAITRSTIIAELKKAAKHSAVASFAILFYLEQPDAKIFIGKTHEDVIHPGRILAGSFRYLDNAIYLPAIQLGSTLERTLRHEIIHAALTNLFGRSIEKNIDRKALFKIWQQQMNSQRPENVPANPFRSGDKNNYEIVLSYLDKVLPRVSKYLSNKQFAQHEWHESVKQYQHIAQVLLEKPFTRLVQSQYTFTPGSTVNLNQRLSIGVQYFEKRISSIRLHALNTYDEKYDVAIIEIIPTNDEEYKACFRAGIQHLQARVAEEKHAGLAEAVAVIYETFPPEILENFFPELTHKITQDIANELTMINQNQLSTSNSNMFKLEL